MYVHPMNAVYNGSKLLPKSLVLIKQEEILCAFKVKEEILSGLLYAYK